MLHLPQLRGFHGQLRALRPGGLALEPGDRRVGAWPLAFGSRQPRSLNMKPHKGAACLFLFLGGREGSLQGRKWSVNPVSAFQKWVVGSRSKGTLLGL